MEILNYIFTEQDLIGKGGMGSVYRAKHKFIEGEMAAVKVINANMITDFTRQLLQQEAENLSSLNHPNIVQFKNYHIDEKGNIYLIMEYVDGLNLEQYVRQETGLIVESRICPIFEPILDAVGYAHKRGAHGKGIMHLDIKPANIIIKKEKTSDGEERIVPKILDFGIAQIIKTSETQNNAEQPKLIMGTPSYMSPEQTKGENLDSRSDIYSLGVLLHQLLIGRQPYDTTTLSEFDINRKVTEEPLPRIKSYYERHSTRVQKVIDKATAKDKKDRYQSCEEFKKALHEAVYPPKVPVWVKTSIAAAIVLIIGVGGWFWDYNRVKVSYYKDYVEQWGVPVGIHKLTSEEVAHRSQSYRIECQKRKVQRMSHVNNKGSVISHNTTDDIDRPADSRYFYNEDGKLDYVKIYLPNGRVEMIKDYVNHDLSVAVFRYDDGLGTEKTLGAETVTTFTKNTDEGGKRSRISRYLLTYDENGHVTELRYAGFQNVPVADADGLYGRKYILDDFGRVKEEIFINQDGNVKATRYGLAIRTREYNDKDDAVRFTYLSPSREPAGEKELGIPVCHNYVDVWGNTIKQVYEGLDGEMMLRRDFNCNAMVMEYSNGDQISQKLLGLDGKPIYMKGQRYSYSVVAYDEHGFQNKLQTFDVEGNAALSNGFHSYECVNDDKGNQLEIWFYDLDGNLVLAYGQCAGIRSTYDSLGNQTSFMYYGTDRKPMVTSSGYSGMINEYDKFGRMTKYTYLDADSVPCYETSNHVGSCRNEYDPSGNLVSVSYYTPSGDSLSLTNENIAGWKMVYDDMGNEIERTFIDEKGKPCAIKYGYARVKNTYDENGNKKTDRYYDMNGQLVAEAGNNYSYDRNGNLLEQYPIGPDEKIRKGKLVLRTKYDGCDNRIEEAVFLDGKPATNSLQWHRHTMKYDNKNQKIEESYYNEKGTLTPVKGKASTVKYEYDGFGNITKFSYFDDKGKPTTCENGFSVTVHEYDVFGNNIHELNYDVDGKPVDPKLWCPEAVAEYDRFGNLIYHASKDGKGNFIPFQSEDYSIVRNEYDDHGNKTSEGYFDKNDKPILAKSNGYHKVISTYDNRDNLTGQMFFGVDGKPMTLKNLGYHKIVYTYDDRDNKTSEAYFNTEGKPINSKDGYHKEVYTYDEQGRKIKEETFNVNGKPVCATNSICSKIVYGYKDGSQVASTAKLYDPKGTLVRSFQRDAEGKWKEVPIQSKRNEKEVLSKSEIKELREMMAQLNSYLPLELDGDYKGLSLVSIKFIENPVRFVATYKVNKSKYEMNEDETTIYALAAAMHIMEVFGDGAKDLDFRLILKDRADRIIFDSDDN